MRRRKPPLRHPDEDETLMRKKNLMSTPNAVGQATRDEHDYVEPLLRHPENENPV